MNAYVIKAITVGIPTSIAATATAHTVLKLAETFIPAPARPLTGFAVKVGVGIVAGFSSAYVSGSLVEKPLEAAFDILENESTEETPEEEN